MVTSNHAPERTCVSCRQVKLKRELIRLVRSSDGGVEIDKKGKKTGRGAYLCKLKGCWRAVLSQRRKDPLAYYLKAKISQKNREELIEFSKTLPEN